MQEWETLAEAPGSFKAEDESLRRAGREARAVLEEKHVMKGQSRLCGEEPDVGVLAVGVLAVEVLAMSCGRRASLKNEMDADLAAEMRGGFVGGEGLDCTVYTYVCMYIGMYSMHVQYVWWGERQTMFADAVEERV